jgi:hypothetical protein
VVDYTATEKNRCICCVTSRTIIVATKRVVAGASPSHIPHYTTKNSVSHMCTVWSQGEWWFVLRIHSSYITHHTVPTEMSITYTPTSLRLTHAARVALSVDMHLTTQPWKGMNDGWSTIATERSQCICCVTVVVGASPSNIPQYATQTSVSHMCTVVTRRMVHVKHQHTNHSPCDTLCSCCTHN